MIQARIQMFETNSSSACTLVVTVVQVDGLDIPTTVHLQEDHQNIHTLNGWYTFAVENNEEQNFFALLRANGVKKIFVNDKPVTVNDDAVPHLANIRDEYVIAQCFGEWKNFSEWYGYNDEWDYSSTLSKEEIRLIQSYYKNPSYRVLCTNGEDDEEIGWDTLPYSKMVITDKDIEEERQYKKHWNAWQQEEERDLQELIDEDNQWEEDDDEYSYRKKNRDKRNKK